MGNLEIYQTAGYQLDQGDADVLYELIRQVFTQGYSGKPEARIAFTRGQLLKALDKAPRGKTRQLLDASIERLYVASFEFCMPGVLTGMSRPLLSVMRHEGSVSEGHDYEILLDIRLAQLFSGGRWSILRRSQRDDLAGDPVAKGLQAYYSTHSTPCPTNVSTLKKLMGREDMQESKWRKVLENALTNLQTATKWHQCEILSADKKEDDKVIVVKILSSKAKGTAGKCTTTTVVTSFASAPPDGEDDI